MKRIDSPEGVMKSLDEEVLGGSEKERPGYQKKGRKQEQSGRGKKVIIFMEWRGGLGRIGKNSRK